MAREKHRIDPLAQAMELRDRYRRANEKSNLEPGILCREKPGMDILRIASVAMFWRWLDPANRQDELLIEREMSGKAFSKVDCLVGFLDTDGDLILMPHESWRLMPCADFPE